MCIQRVEAVMGNESDQLLPQGTQSLQNILPVPPSNDVISLSAADLRSNLFPLPHSSAQTFPHQCVSISNGSQAEFESKSNIETAAWHAVLHEQEISTQQIIQSQRFVGRFHLIGLSPYVGNGIMKSALE